MKICAAKTLVGSLAILCVLTAGHAQNWLVSPAEVLAFQGRAGFESEPLLQAKGLPPALSIDVYKPELGADFKVVAPFSIAVQFKPQPDAEVDPSTFRAFYGFMRLDITSRITKYVTITPAGFSLENANIPHGKHSLLLQVQDSKHRVAEKELKFEVQ